MSFVDNLRGFIAKRQPALAQIKSEDQAKLALVFPLLRHLGYDTTDPLEIVPEFTADHATKKGEKVDIAIFIDGKPAVLIECKSPGSDLNSHNGQLYRYFSVTEAKFAILTNGRDYWFFSDVDEPNKMDSKPFMAIDLFDATDADLKELERFEKSCFDPTEVAESAEQLKKMNLMKNVLARELGDPSDDLVRLLSREINAGRMTHSKLEDFRSITQKAIKEHLREYLNAHLKKAMDRISEDSSDTNDIADESLSDAHEVVATEQNRITEFEAESLRIVKAILSRAVKADRIGLRDGKSYKTVLLDEKPRSRIAIFRFGSRKKIVEILGEMPSRFIISNPEDIYEHCDEFLTALSGLGGND